MQALSEKDSGRAMQLRYNHTLGSVDHKRSFLGHVRNGTQVHILNDGCKVFVIGVGAIQVELRL